MIYIAKHNRVVGVPVELEGQSLIAFAAEGKAHLVSADVFALLFHAEQASAPVLEKLSAVRKRLAHKPYKPPVQRKTPGKQAMEAARSAGDEPDEPPTLGAVAQRAVDLLRVGPLTHSELASNLYQGEKDVKKRSDCTYAVEGTLRDKGLIEKREDHGLVKWHLIQRGQQ